MPETRVRTAAGAGAGAVRAAAITVAPEGAASCLRRHQGSEARSRAHAVDPTVWRSTTSSAARSTQRADRDGLPVPRSRPAWAAATRSPSPTCAQGETVLDLGSGGGIDVLLSARRVGPTGYAYGVDMTDEMLDLARANAAKAGATNVEFVKGTIEDVPLPDASVDVVISNCVINLSTDKPAVLAEMFRVLTPGGRFGISDVVAEDHLDPGGPGRARQLRRLHRRRAVTSASTSTAWPPPDSPMPRSFTHQVADGMHGAIIQAIKLETSAR